jgi:hypothetical protein
MTLNERREKARDAVKACIQNFRGCSACPYDIDFDTYECRKVFGDDLIELLTPQEARLVTYDDFHSGREDGGEAIPCWKETKSPTRRSGWAVVVWGKVLADADYGVARYWTLRPTDEQRQQTPWKG